MMMRRVLMMVMLSAMFAGGVLLPSPLHMQVYAQTAPGEADGPEIKYDANGNPQTQVTGGSAVTCDTLPEAKGGALLGKIVPCLVYTISQSTVKFTEQMVNWLSPLLFTFLLFVIVMFGVRVLQNEPQVYKQGFLLLVKIAIIATILADLNNTQAYDGSAGAGKLIPAVYGVMAEGQKIVANTISASSMKCDIATYGDAQTPQIWRMMDCVMGKLYGFTVSSPGKPSMLLMTSMAGLLSGFLFGGAWGVAVFFGMIGVLFTMFSMVIRTVIGFLMGYLIICLMLIVSPLFLPLAFLRGTAQYYESYLRTILGAFLTPLIISAYSMFALLVYDQMLFAPNSIVSKIFDFKMIQNAIQPSRPGCNREVTGDPFDVRVDTTPTAAQKDAIMSTPNLQNLAFPTLSGGNDTCGAFKLPIFKMDQMQGSVAGKQHDELTQMFMELVNLFILAYLISQGQSALPGIISQLVGRNSGTAGVNAVMSNDGKFKTSYNNAMQRSMAAFQKKPGDSTSGYVSGGEYFRTLPQNLKNAARSSVDSYNTLKK